MVSLDGLMQPWPMTVDKFLDHAARWHGTREVVSFLDNGKTERSTYSEIRRRAKRLSNALLARGVERGDRIATLAMNGGGHLAAWYAIAGIGAVCHTLNPRIGDEQLAWIANHAEDRILIADGAFAEMADALAGKCGSIEHLIFLTEPQTQPVTPYQLLEDFIAWHDDDCQWGGFDENSAAGLCYTSGTSGRPKGVLYSHRSNMLHTLISMQPDAFRFSACDTIMPVVPMYHANAWGITFSAPAVGAKLVLPGSDLSGATLARRMRDENVTFSAGVPTAWLGLLDHLESAKESLPDLKRVVVGGAPMAEQLMRRFDRLGIEAMAAWGMTELSPIGSVASPIPETAALPYEEQVPFRVKQGRVPFGVDLRITDEDGRDLAHDGLQQGLIMVRGPAIASAYYRSDQSPIVSDGWLNTADVGTVDRFGFMKITDRAKDIIKSGGEWISSIDIENAASTFPGIGLVAVIGIPHPKWDERPLLLFTQANDLIVDISALQEHLASSLPKWWMPDEIRCVPSIPLGATGKIDKKALRATLLD